MGCDAHADTNAACGGARSVCGPGAVGLWSARGRLAVGHHCAAEWVVEDDGWMMVRLCVGRLEGERSITPGNPRRVARRTRRTVVLGHRTHLTRVE